MDQLVADVRRLQTALTKLKEAQVDAASDLAEKLAAAEAEAAEAKVKLEAMSDYDEVKKELGWVECDRALGLKECLVIGCMYCLIATSQPIHMLLIECTIFLTIHFNESTQSNL